MPFEDIKQWGAASNQFNSKLPKHHPLNKTRGSNMAIPMAQKAFMCMMTLFAAIFWANPGNMILLASFPNIQDNALALQVGNVYLQVVGSFSAMMVSFTLA